MSLIQGTNIYYKKHSNIHGQHWGIATIASNLCACKHVLLPLLCLCCWQESGTSIKGACRSVCLRIGLLFLFGGVLGKQGVVFTRLSYGGDIVKEEYPIK